MTELLPGVNLDPARTVAFVCGPEIMMRFVARVLLDLGLAPTALYVSLERNMQCAVGICGHCQLGPRFVCAEGPVFRFDEVAELLGVDEL